MSTFEPAGRADRVPVIIIELEPDAPAAYVDEFTSFLRQFRWVKDAHWELQSDGGRQV